MKDSYHSQIQKKNRQLRQALWDHLGFSQSMTPNDRSRRALCPLRMKHDAPFQQPFHHLCFEGADTHERAVESPKLVGSIAAKQKRATNE